MAISLADRGPVAALPCASTTISSRTTRWVWPGGGLPVDLEVDVTVEVVELRRQGLGRSQVSYHVQAFRLDADLPLLIADEPFHGPLAMARSLRFAATGWACFEAISHERGVA